MKNMQQILCNVMQDLQQLSLKKKSKKWSYVFIELYFSSGKLLQHRQKSPGETFHLIWLLASGGK